MLNILKNALQFNMIFDNIEKFASLNVQKYLPNKILPENVLAVPDLDEAVKDADILIFVIPHQFVKQTCEELKSKVKSDAFAITLIKV